MARFSRLATFGRYTVNVFIVQLNYYVLVNALSAHFGEQMEEEFCFCEREKSIR